MAQPTEPLAAERSRSVEEAGGSDGGAAAAPGRRAEEAGGIGGDAARGAAAPSAPAAAAFGSEERECRVCYNPFDPGARAPKLLACLHTFCQDCLSQMHRHQARGGAEGPGAAAPAITCPLCRHRTALPEGRAQSLPLNTRLLPRLSPERLQLLPLTRAPAPALQRPLPDQPGPGAPPSGAGAAAPGAGGRCGEGDRRSRRQEARTVRCVCIVFTFFSMMVISITGPLFLNYSGWVELFMVSLFLVVAIVLALFSIMPYLRFLHSHEYRTVAAAWLAGEGASGPRGATPGPVTMPGRSLARAGQGQG